MDRLPFAVKEPVWRRMGYKANASALAFHHDLSDISLISGGVRSGKSVCISAETVPHVLVPSPTPYLVPLIGPTYTEPRAEFDYIAGWLQDLGVLDAKDISRPKEGPAEFTIRPKSTRFGTVYGANVRTYTASEVESIRSFNAEFMVVCEAGGIEKESFYNILERVASTGGFIIGSGTLEISQAWYYDLINEGQMPENTKGVRSFIVPTWENTASFPGGREDPKIKRVEAVIPKERFDVRFGGKPVRVMGLVIQNADPLTTVSLEAEYIPGHAVELAIDPGYSGAYAILAIQRREGGIYIVDEVYEQFFTTEQIIEVCQEKPWWVDVAQDNPGVIDRAAKQHHSADSVLEKWEELTGFWLDLNEAVIPVEDGADQLRMYLAAKRLFVNPGCHGLLAEWGLCESPVPNQQPWQYRRDKTGTLRGDRAVTGADHASTALTYWLINRYGFVSPEYLSKSFGFSAMFTIRGAENSEYGPKAARRANPMAVVSG